MSLKEENSKETVWIAPPVRLSAAVWKHFKLSRDRSKTLCKICDSIVPSVNGNTTNLNKHMLRHHPEVDIGKKSSKSNLKLTSESAPSQSESKAKNSLFGIKRGSGQEKRITDSLMFYIIKDLQ